MTDRESREFWAALIITNVWGAFGAAASGWLRWLWVPWLIVAVSILLSGIRRKVRIDKCPLDTNQYSAEFVNCISYKNAWCSCPLDTGGKQIHHVNCHNYGEGG